jgi:hypothetical protein
MQLARPMYPGRVVVREPAPTVTYEQPAYPPPAVIVAPRYGYYGGGYYGGYYRRW